MLDIFYRWSCSICGLILHIEKQWWQQIVQVHGGKWYFMEFLWFFYPSLSFSKLHFFSFYTRFKTTIFAFLILYLGVTPNERAPKRKHFICFVIILVLFWIFCLHIDLCDKTLRYMILYIVWTIVMIHPPIMYGDNLFVPLDHNHPNVVNISFGSKLEQSQYIHHANVIVFMKQHKK